MPNSRGRVVPQLPNHSVKPIAINADSGWCSSRCGMTGGSMVVRVLRLGTPRSEGEGIRIGTVRRPPRGVPKAEFASKNWYDVWFPTLAPSVATVKLAQKANTPAGWANFVKRYRSEMAKPEANHALDLLAKLSHRTNFSV